MQGLDGWVEGQHAQKGQTSACIVYPTLHHLVWAHPPMCKLRLSQRERFVADTQALLGGAHIALTCLDLKQMRLATALTCVLFLLTVTPS